MGMLVQRFRGITGVQGTAKLNKNGTTIGRYFTCSKFCDWEMRLIKNLSMRLIWWPNRKQHSGPLCPTKIDIEDFRLLSKQCKNLQHIRVTLQKSYFLLLPQHKSETTHFNEAESEWCEEINLFVPEGWHHEWGGMDGYIADVLLLLLLLEY